jgi:hypothetical protein
MPARSRGPSATDGTDTLLYLLFGALGATLLAGTLAWLTGNLTNLALASGHGGWAPLSVTAALLHPERVWPRLSPAAVLLGARIAPGLLTLALLTGAAIAWQRYRAGARSGLARTADLAPLLAKQTAQKALGLRPGLAGSGRSWKRGTGR